MGPPGTIHNPVDGGHATLNCYKIEPGMTFLPAVMIPNRIWLNQWAVQKEHISKSTSFSGKNMMAHIVHSKVTKRHFDLGIVYIHLGTA